MANHWLKASKTHDGIAEFVTFVYLIQYFLTLAC